MAKRIQKLIAIGLSTGGPRALNTIIPAIPKCIPAAFLIVQHMPPKFTASLAERLNLVSNLVVKEAEHREIIKSGHVYIAPGGCHMKVSGCDLNSLQIELSDTDLVSGHKPSVDVLFESIAKMSIKGVIAVVLTGMGADGSHQIEGIKKIEGNKVIVQDEQTSVVYGMPGAVVKTGLVDKILPLENITEELLNLTGVYIDGCKPVP